MPTKGRPMIGVRMSREMKADLLEQIAFSNEHRRDEPWTVSTFCETAIAEKLAKMRRGRRQKAQRLLRRDELDE